MTDNNTNQGAVITPKDFLESKGIKPVSNNATALNVWIVKTYLQEYAELYAASKLKEKEQEIEEWQKAVSDISTLHEKSVKQYQELKAKAYKLEEALKEISENEDSELSINWMLAKQALSVYQSENKK